MQSKEWLEQKYLNEELTPQAIGAICGVNKTTIRAWLLKHNISIRNISEARYIFTKHNPSFQDGDKHPMWNGGRTRRYGYILIKNRSHPFSDKKGYITEHRLVTQQNEAPSLASIA